MNTLSAFAHEIESRLASTRREPSWSPEERERYMFAYAKRQAEFEHFAAHLISNIIEPRMEKLASYFPNSKCTCAPEHGWCLCRFGYCERFPASVTLQMRIEHDNDLGQVVVHRELCMVPRILKFDQHEKLSGSRVETDDEHVTIWTEQQLLKFLVTYLQTDRGLADFDDEVVLDPVCGMRIRRAEAVAFDDRVGRRLWFCSADCQRQFADDPHRFMGQTESGD